jgi:hypothetical protein
LSALRRHVLANPFRNTVVVAWPHLLKSLGFDATSLKHFDAAELAPSTASLAPDVVRAENSFISAFPQNRTSDYRSLGQDREATTLGSMDRMAAMQ